MVKLTIRIELCKQMDIFLQPGKVHVELGRNHCPTLPRRNGLWSLAEITPPPRHAATVYGVWQKSLIFTNVSTVKSILYSC